MGLDMYLTGRIYIGGNYEHVNAVGAVDIEYGHPAHRQKLHLDAKKVGSIEVPVGYWRKANQIHGWFVDNVQDGRDECQDSYVSKERLMELKALCEEALKTKDGSALPPREGFFFGSTKFDEGYWQDLEDTVRILTDLPEDMDFYYHSSW